MTKYVENVNAYLSQMKIKQNHICKKSGIDAKKLSRETLINSNIFG